MDRNVLHGVMKNVNVNTLENVKGPESKIKSFSSFYHVAFFYHLRKFQKIQKIEIVARWGHGLVHSRDGHGPSSNVSSMVSSLI